MAGGPGLTPDRALKVLHAAWRGKVIFTLSLSCPSPLFPIPQEEAAGCETRPPELGHSPGFRLKAGTRVSGL